MNNMSASDAAPLPRLGEVFFDVRGSSRSMRLSWYSDTGVAVFSIWQGGTCTGTFRLPIEELPRLVGALQRGPADGPDFRGQSGLGDPRGPGDMRGLPRQLPGAPTDPRLRVVPGYGGPYDGDYAGPATGDFRALRPDDPNGTGAIRPVRAQLALPAPTQAGPTQPAPGNRGRGPKEIS